MKKYIEISSLFFCFLAILSTIYGLSQTSNLRFSHKTHADARIKCEACHKEKPNPSGMPTLPEGWAPLRLSRIASLPRILNEPTTASAPPAPPVTFGRPPEKVCLACHFQNKKKSDCGLCHLGKPGKTERDRERNKLKPGFSHQKHSKTDCTECHSKVEAWESLDGKQVDFGMKGCLKCHIGLKAKMTCVLCHSKTPRPADHGRFYEKKHGLDYRLDPKSCQPCHEDSSCLACHSRRPRDHTPAWVARRHGLSAEADPLKCQACHQDKEVCSRCHGDK
ncbi:MAG: cytochrome c3 family protein [Candidatus Riflebacteria bacterium]|nr:cytochrome c3 family protein [Candidatus Riflebacteria bacterium]